MLAISASNCGPTLTVMVLFLISSSSFSCLSLRISLQLSSRLRVPSWPRQSSPGEDSILSQIYRTDCSQVFEDLITLLTQSHTSHTISIDKETQPGTIKTTLRL